MINPELKVGDRVVCYSMDDTIAFVNAGTIGTVTRIGPDPFDRNEIIYYMRWDDGSTLSLIPSVDKWKLLKQKIQEQPNREDDPHTHFMATNRELRRSMDLPYFLEYFKLLQKSGITNMFGSSNFVYMDSVHLDRYYGEKRGDNEDFQNLLEIQDEARSKFLSGLVKFAELKNIELSDDSKINSLARRLGISLLQYYMTFYH
jgi:hypothetical protein